MAIISSQPKLTFPPSVAERVQAEYENANVILEYGSGGSTVLAAKQPNTRVFAVESDKDWADSLHSYIEKQKPEASVTIHYANIGPTGDWGHPLRYRKMHSLRYLGYSRSVWNRTDFIHPDVILIDGRFRVGCFLTCLSRIKRPTRILFDDYLDRPTYHVVERYSRPVETVGRMAIFSAKPEDARQLSSLRRIREEMHRLSALPMRRPWKKASKQ